jgi:hypothetical protein
MIKFFPAIVIHGDYTGHKGLATAMNLFGNVVFYFDEEALPLRACLKLEDIQYLD